MKLKAIPTVLDVIFVFIATLAVSFAVLRFYLSSLVATAVLSVIFAVLTTTLFRHVAKKRNATYAMKVADREKMEATLNTLCLMTDGELKQFFALLFNKLQIPASEIDDGLFLPQLNAEVRFYFTFSPPGEGRITEFYKRAEKGRNILVLGREFKEELHELTARFAGRIRLIDGASLYLTMKRADTFPPESNALKKPKVRLNLLRAMLCKRRARQYFLYGITLEFFSFFTFYPTYYVCFGAALIVLSIICYFFGIKDEPKEENPFKAQ